MAAEDYFDWADFDDSDLDPGMVFSRYQRRQTPITCKYCGSTAVYWHREDDKWKLMDLETDALHICDRKPSARSDFSD